MEKHLVICPGCGVRLPSEQDDLDKDFVASAACRALWYELTYYTVSLPDPSFIHQLGVDAYAAQHAGPQVKPITTAFALVGLYLVCEKGYTGKQVQRVHMALANANRSRVWPLFSVPTEKASLTIQDVVQSPDANKPAMIKQWCQSVWDIWKSEEGRVATLLDTYLKTA